MPLNIASATLTQTPPGNALLRAFKVWAQADTAGAMRLKDLGQVRAQVSTSQVNGGGTTVIVDLGAPLTVGGASAAVGGKDYKIVAVYRWQGAAFDVVNFVYSNPSGAVTISFPEVSTARLQLELQGTVSLADAEQVTVTLPSIPADLEVHVNDGPAVWRYPGPRGAPGVDGWVPDSTNTYTQHEVDLTDVVAPLLANPDKPANVPVTVELRARVPGRLAVLLKTLDYDLLERVTVLPEPDLTFEAEGEQAVALQAPGAGTELKEVWVTLAGAPPKERAVPAVGPQRVNEVALLLDPGRSATVRFPEGQLGELTALRLPLTAQDGTAEVRALLLAPVGTLGADEPGPPMEGATATQPVQLEAPPTQPRGLSGGVTVDPDTWVLLPFDKPVKLEGPVWVQLQVARGLVRWSLGQYGQEDGTPYPVRRGSPTGPWLPLPGAVTALTNLGGRLHAIGHAPKASPLAPVRLQIRFSSWFFSTVAEVTPAAKGVTVKLPVQFSGVLSNQSWLRVISRAAATVTVQSLLRVVAAP